MQYHIEARGKTKQYIEGLLPSMLSQLSLTRSRQFLHIMAMRGKLHDLFFMQFALLLIEDVLQSLA